MTLQQEIDTQVAAGMCTRGETATGCLMADGTEAACQTIRECAPSQHFEYALPESSPNRNIWVWNGDKMVWSGTVETTPVSQPGFGVDMFSGKPVPTINYDLIPYIPPPVYGPGRAPATYDGNRGTSGNGSSSGTPIAPSYGLGLSQDIQTLLRSTLGRTVVSQGEFCVAYARLAGYACDFDAAEGGTKDAAAWLAQLQSQQNARVSVMGNRPLPGYQTPPTDTGGGVSHAVQTSNPVGNLDLSKMMPLILIGIVIFLVAKK